MTRKRVLIIESGQFLGGVICSLFASCEQLEVLTTNPASYRRLLAVVRETQPEIVILDDTRSDDYLKHLLISMQTSGVLRIIVVNTESNQVQMYYKQKITVRQSQDVFAIL